jgi:hypothetical protein
MKNLALSLIIITLSVSLAQSKWRGFEGGAGGFSFYIVEPNLGALNTELKALGMPEFDGLMFLYGAQGYAFVSDRLRIGGMGFGGSITSEDIENGYAREATFSMTWGGFLLEYLVFEDWGIEAFAGGTLGWGGVSVHLRKTLSPIDWDEVWNNYQATSGTTDNISTQFDHSFFLVQPRVGLKYYLLDWMAVGVSVDVPILNLDSDGWTIDGDDVYDAPSLDLTQPFYQFSILFGG